MPQKKQSLQMNVRVTRETRTILDDIEEKTHQKDTHILQHLLESLAKHWTEKHEITFPVHFATSIEVTKTSGTTERRRQITSAK